MARTSHGGDKAFHSSTYIYHQTFCTGHKGTMLLQRGGNCHWGAAVNKAKSRADGIEFPVIPIQSTKTICTHCTTNSILLQLRATLDKGPRSQDQWIQAILLVESFKLVPRPLNEGLRPESGKLRLNLHGTCFGGKINWFKQNNSAKGRTPYLENEEESRYGPRYSPTWFNLLQISPNWFLGNWIWTLL